MDRKRLVEILESHNKWVNGEDGGICANLWGADLRGAKNFNIPFSCPSDGAFVGWKKCRDGLIVKLQIPSSAKRLSATGRKCICDKAKVLAIQNEDGTNAKVEFATSCHDSSFIYRVGKYVSVGNFDEDRWNECSTGIHFFITREEAVQYGVI